MRRQPKGLRSILAKRQNRLATLLAICIMALGAQKISERSHRGDAEQLLDSVIAIQYANGFVVGSGVVIDDGRYAITVYHVVDDFIDDNKPIMVRYHDGRIVEAHAIKCNKHFDIALLELPYRAVPGLNVISDREVRQGDHVRALGHPFGITWMVSDGVVSRKSYFPPNKDGKEFVIWTTAWIEGGSSGGPLVNDRGNIVGLVMSFLNLHGVKYGAQHLNLCVSGSEILRFLES
jgi:S1-C subfamily serine protease